MNLVMYIIRKLKLVKQTFKICHFIILDYKNV